MKIGISKNICFPNIVYMIPGHFACTIGNFDGETKFGICEKL